MTTEQVKAQCLLSRRAVPSLADFGTRKRILLSVSEALVSHSGEILAANSIDMENASALSDAMRDRLLLTEKRLEAVSESAEYLSTLGDPLGETETNVRPNGLRIEKTRVPLGVVGMIYEARPNVTADAALLCIKSGNAVILRGGKEAVCSNRAIAAVIRDAVKNAGGDPEAVFIIPDTDRESVANMLSLRGYIDLIIPRGGKGLISSVTQNSKVPVIETGAGNCHIYIHESADISKAVSITVNAKTQRPSVCNAAETLLCDRKAAKTVLPAVLCALKSRGVVLRATEEVRSLIPGCEQATDEDFATEYNDLIMSVKLVSGVDEAADHINRYGTGHSEAIIAEDRAATDRFMDRVDAAAVYVNASTRFTDGGLYGLGAEIGISTQKLHVRGPFADEALTTVKYRVYGNGQVRE